MLIRVDEMLELFVDVLQLHTTQTDKQEKLSAGQRLLVHSLLTLPVDFFGRRAREKILDCLVLLEYDPESLAEQLSAIVRLLEAPHMTSKLVGPPSLC